MYKNYLTVLILPLILCFSLNSKASVILESGESFSAAFNLESDGNYFKTTDFFWDVEASFIINGSSFADVTVTLFENSNLTGQVFSQERSFSNVDPGLLSTYLAGQDVGLFTDFDGSFIVQNTGSSQIELFDITIANFAGSVGPSNVAVDTIVPSAVPLPAAAWLFLSGIFSLGFLSIKRKRQS